MTKDNQGKDLVKELHAVQKKQKYAKLTKIKHDVVQAYSFTRDFLTASALTVLIGYGVDKALRTEAHKSLVQVAVVFSGCLILILALAAWGKVIRNYKAEE